MSRRTIAGPAVLCRAPRLIGRFGAKALHQIVPVEPQQRRRKFAIAGISGPFVATLDAELLDQLLNVLRTIACGELIDERLKVLFAERLANRWPAGDEVPRIMSQNQLAARGRNRRQVDLSRDDGGH